MSGSHRTRLTDSAEFKRVYHQGVSYRGKLFSVHAFPNDARATRLGLSVSKKVGNAVTRNKVRRKLKEIFRDSAPGAPDLDIVISARPYSADASFEDLREEFHRALQKLVSQGQHLNRK